MTLPSALTYVNTSQIPQEIDIINTTTGLHVRKLRHQEGKWPAHCHTASKMQSWDLNPGHLAQVLCMLWTITQWSSRIAWVRLPWGDLLIQTPVPHFGASGPGAWAWAWELACLAGSTWTPTLLVWKALFMSWGFKALHLFIRYDSTTSLCVLYLQLKTICSQAVLLLSLKQCKPAGGRSTSTCVTHTCDWLNPWGVIKWG